jgi:hypothetical protein
MPSEDAVVLEPSASTAGVHQAGDSQLNLSNFWDVPKPSDGCFRGWEAFPFPQLRKSTSEQELSLKRVSQRCGSTSLQVITMQLAV